jgi:serine-type D-Ala-D-Ala carboxypeptidase/endopeptidase (penicillin-binding protein 4)
MYALSLSSKHHPTSTVSLRRVWSMLLVGVLVATLSTGCAASKSVAAARWVSAPVVFAPIPDSKALTTKLKAVSAKSAGSTSVVVTTTDGTVLTNRAGATALAPASTMKLLTTAVALDTLGAAQTFSTKVVSSSDDHIILVGGGDPLLTDAASKSVYKLASLEKLAKATARALKAAGRTQVSLGYDASLFTGPTFSPSWKTQWHDSEARIAALEADSGLVSPLEAEGDPAKAAATAFAKRLRSAGIKVTTISTAKAAAADAELAKVTSASLALIVKHTLLASDNVGAETISRQAALASGQEGSFAGAATNVTTWLRSHGLSSSGQKILDGSGLSPSNRVAATTLAGVIRLALADSKYQALIAGLPVAGVTGTLASRFDDSTEAGGRGKVHAKTGTLQGVAALAGYLTTSQGATLVFAEISNGATGTEAAYDWLDRTATAAVTCNCS